MALSGAMQRITQLLRQQRCTGFYTVNQWQAFTRQRPSSWAGGHAAMCSLRTFGSSPRLNNIKMVRRDIKRRQCVADHFKERLQLRAVLKNKILPEVVQKKAKASLLEQPRDASITRVRNRCVATGRGRGVLTRFKLSRMRFRKLGDFGMLSGVTRSSW